MLVGVGVLRCGSRIKKKDLPMKDGGCETLSVEADMRNNNRKHEQIAAGHLEAENACDSAARLGWTGMTAPVGRRNVPPGCSEPLSRLGLVVPKYLELPRRFDE